MTTDAAPSTPTRPMRGDPALQALYAQHFATVRKALNFLGVPRSEQADLATEVWIAAFCRWHDEPIRDPGAWLFTIAQRCAFTHRRMWARFARALDITEERNMPGIDVFSEAEEKAHVEARVRLLDQALDALTPEERDVFIAHALGGMTLSEYARSKKITRKVVNKRYAAAKKRLYAIVLGMEQREPQKSRAWLPGALALFSTADTEALRAEVWARAWNAIDSYNPNIGTPSNRSKAPTNRQLHFVPLPIPPLHALGLASNAIVAALLAWQACTPVPAREPPPRSSTVATIADEAPPLPANATPGPSLLDTIGSPTSSAAPPAIPSMAPAPIAAQPERSSALIREVALIRGADHAIQEGRYDVAARALAQHAQDFPEGSLIEEREVLRETLRRARARQ